MGINHKERELLNVNQFLGIDFTTSPLKVDMRRAVSGVNFITDYGTLKKRNGWIEKIKFAGKKINGMFRYTNFTIIRAGDYIYKLEDDLTYTTLYTIPERDNEIVSFFVMNSNVYIVGLGKFIYMHQNGLDINNKPIYIIEDVKNVATIPTTTISIDDTTSSSNNQTTLEPVNLLTNKRRNTLLGSSTSNLSWLLDSGIREENDVVTEVLVDIEFWDSTNLATKHYKTFPEATGVEHYLFDENETTFITGNAKGLLEKIYEGNIVEYFWEQISDIEYIKLTNRLIEDISPLEGTPTVSTLDNLYTPNYALWNQYNGSLGVKYITGNSTTYWKLNKTENYSSLGMYRKVRIYSDTVPPVEGADNITVTFETEQIIDSSNIESATSGVIFGVNGTTNQLFLAYKGYEYYSKAYDFHYFPDNQTNILGNGENPILGYSRMSDTSLIIYKDSEAYESRLFFRTMDLTTNSETYEIEYTLYDKAIDVNIGCDARRSIANLNGDNLFLSKEGIYAVTLGDNVSVESRHVKERSMYVNKKLKQEVIENGIAIVFDSRYYIAFDGDVYVADARYKSSSELSDTFNYEFFYWENIPVTSWVIINNELWFGTEEGRICKFDDQFSDRTLIKATEGEVTLVVSNNYLVYNQEIEVNENDEIYADCYQLVLSANQIESITNGLIKSTLSDIENIFYEGQKVYIRNIDSNLTEEYAYTIYGTNINQFYLKDGSGSLVTNITGTFDIIINLLNETMYVTNLDTENSQFQLKPNINGSAVSLVSYTINPITFTIVVNNPVKMVWYSSIFDLGTNLYSKTLLSMTISADATTTGEIDFGYDTRNISSNIQSLNYQEFTFEDIDFNNFTFLTAIASSFTKKVKEKDFNFIIIKLGSDTPTSAVINTYTLQYKINKINKGIR